MKKLFAFFLVLAISAGFTSVHAMIGSAPVHPVLTETEELTEEEFIAVLASAQWSYSNPVKKNTVYLEFHEDGTAVMQTGDITYDMTWETAGQSMISAVMEAEGIVYRYNLRLVLKDSGYELHETSHREMVWIVSELY